MDRPKKGMTGVQSSVCEGQLRMVNRGFVGATHRKQPRRCCRPAACASWQACGDTRERHSTWLWGLSLTEAQPVDTANHRAPPAPITPVTPQQERARGFPNGRIPHTPQGSATRSPTVLPHSHARTPRWHPSKSLP
jgi:hypothetical protein